MSDIIIAMHNKDHAKEDETTEEVYEALAGNLESLLKAAEPRLGHLARRYGVPADVIGDVVQDTLVAAWQNLAHLRSPEHFEFWLDGICRNMSLRWARTQNTIDQHQRPFSALRPEPSSAQEYTHTSPIFEIADPQTFDLAEELSRQDLAVLLSRAMSYLPATTRQALEMHYLADLPQREVALRLGMTINNLEVKLHRARHQLRQVLQYELRADAESFGLFSVNETEARRWRDTSIWCCICGQQRLQGLFEAQPGGEVDLRLRCPTCSVVMGDDIINSAKQVQFEKIRSFRPAFKRVLRTLPAAYLEAFTTGNGACHFCGKPALLLGIEPEVLPPPFYTRFSIVFSCPDCGRSASSIFALCLAYPAAYQFVMQHERCILEPEKLIDYHEQPALSASLCDLASGARLTLILQRQTLQLLEVSQS